MRMILRALRYYFTGGNKAVGNRQADTTPIEGVCWEPYMGRWYEWARYDTAFEYGLDDVYAEYELRDDGGVRISNYGTDAKGRQQRADGRATISGEGELTISFVPLLSFISSQYRVLYVDKAYTHALVSNAGGTCLWLLGREAHYQTQAYRRLCDEATSRGFDLSALRLTGQECESR